MLVGVSLANGNPAIPFRVSRGWEAWLVRSTMIALGMPRLKAPAQTADPLLLTLPKRGPEDVHYNKPPF